MSEFQINTGGRYARFRDRGNRDSMLLVNVLLFLILLVTGVRLGFDIANEVRYKRAEDAVERMIEDMGKLGM